MGKRERSVSVPFSRDEIHITRHAIRRFRQRIEAIEEATVPFRVGRLLQESTPVYRTRSADQNYYLANSLCIFAISPDGVIVTVLQNRYIETARSVKERRKTQRSTEIANKGKRPSKRWKARTQRHSKERKNHDENEG